MIDNKTKEPKPQGYFAKLIDQIRARGMPVPAALIGEAKPLALSTRSDLPAWGERNGYDEDALRLLNSAIGAHVRSAAYQLALSADLAERVDLDGRAAGNVSELDRHSAALLLFTRGLRDEVKRGAKPALKAAEPSTAPSASSLPSPSALPSSSSPSSTSPPSPAAPAKRPIIRLGGLSPEEIERRRIALTGVGR